MIRICSYCRLVLGEKPPVEDKRHTHTICDGCAPLILEELEGRRYEKYFEGSDNPIIIVNHLARVVSSNQKAADLVNKPTKMIAGFLAGEAIDCQYAKIDDGCGQTTHCPNCKIRNLINQTIESKSTFEKMPVQLKTESGIVEMVISTEYIEGLVKISIHSP